MSKLLLHPQTKRTLDAFLARPSHAVILSGPAGSGKFALAGRTAEILLELEPENLTRYPYFRHISLTSGSKIGIETVRELEHFLSLKVPRSTTANRIVIIEQAELLSEEAQNALLKTLEEPPDGTVIILTAAHEQALLPTIRSRVQPVRVLAPPKADVHAFFQAAGRDAKAIGRAYDMSGGLPGLMHALLNGEEHPLLAVTEQVRQLLRQNQFERLLTVNRLAKQKDEAFNLTFILQQMAHVSLQTAQGSAARRWQQVFTASYRANEALAANGQAKLVLTRLMLEL